MIPATQAALQYGYGLIFDDVRNITCLQDSNQFETLHENSDPVAARFTPGDPTAAICDSDGTRLR